MKFGADPLFKPEFRVHRSTIERIGKHSPEAANDSTGFDAHGFHFGATVSRKGRVKINAGKSRKTTTRDSAALKALRLKSLRRKFKRNKTPRRGGSARGGTRRGSARRRSLWGTCGSRTRSCGS